MCRRNSKVSAVSLLGKTAMLAFALGAYSTIGSARDEPEPIVSDEFASFYSSSPPTSDFADPSHWDDLHRRLELQQHQLSEQAARLELLERAAAEPVSAGPPATDESIRWDDWAPESGPVIVAPGECASACYPEYSLGGQYRLMFNGANFDFHEAVISDHQPSQTFFNQRLRTWLTVQTSEHVEAYIQVEVGHIAWGENFEFPKTYVGPRFPPADDRVGIELRRGYLTYHSDETGRWRAGIQDWQDSFDQTLASSDWDFSVGGLSWSTTLEVAGEMRLLAGAFVLFEGDVRQADDTILWTLDGDWGQAETGSFGWSVYAVTDHGHYSYPTAPPYDSSWDMWWGLRGTLPMPLVPLHGFAIYNVGQRNELGGAPDFRHQGFAAKLATGPHFCWGGELRLQALYATGEGDPSARNSSEFRTVAQSVRDNFGAQGYWSYLAITSPQGPSDVNDLGVSLQNRGLGLFTAQAVFDYPIHECLTGKFAVGWLRSAAPNPTSGACEMGTELLKMFTYDFGGGLKADLGAAVLFTGDFYKPAPDAPAPDLLWETFCRVQLEF